MGLLCGSRVFRKGGLLNILRESDVIIPTQEDIESKRPIFYAFDAMCKLTGLRGIGPPAGKNSSSGIDRWILPGAKRACEEAPDVYSPRQIAESLFRPLEVFVACHPHTHVTIGLMCDVGSDVPKEKHALQKHRTRKSSVVPYDVDGKSCEITDEGLVIGSQDPVLLNMYSLMATRSVRPQLYAYFRQWIQQHQWRNKFTLIFDADFPGLGHQAFSFDILPGVEPEEKVVDHSQTGEGEISALVWALRYRDTHFVQLHSGDLDLLVLMIIHGHKFKYPIRSVLCGRYVADYVEILAVLATHHLTKDDLVIGSMMLGTDFISKKELSHRAYSNSVFDAVRTWRLLSSDPPLLRIKNCNRQHLSEVMTVANNMHKNDIRWAKAGKTAYVPDYPPPVMHSRILKQMQMGGCKKYRVEISLLGLQQLYFNMQYWTLLDGDTELLEA